MKEGYSLEQLEERIGYCFQEKALLKQAITHSSYANERKINKIKDYERLEFLGDAVLELMTSEFLFREYPDMPEGQMTKLRSSLVCEPSLAYCAKDLELGDFLYLGKGEEVTGGRNRDSIISDCMEAMIGAIYVDGGFASAKQFVDTVVLSDLENKKLFYDSKTFLQELLQRDNCGNLHYECISETGPDHDKEFVVEAMLDQEVIGRGTGRTKKAAEQQAAYMAIKDLQQNLHSQS